MTEQERLISLYELAEQNDIDVDWVTTTMAPALAVELPDGKCCIALNPLMFDMPDDEFLRLLHELGHCLTHSFYTRTASRIDRARAENRANRWGYRTFLPPEELQRVLLTGRTTPADIADHLGLPEQFVTDAIAYYTGPRNMRFRVPR